MTDTSQWVPSYRASLLVLGAPPVAVVLCSLWSYFAWSLVPEAVLESDAGRRAALFWASDMPGWLFCVPMLLLGAIALARALWENQVWLCLLVVAYYVPSFFVACLATLLFARFKPFP
jgi:hypothetical protein